MFFCLFNVGTSKRYSFLYYFFSYYNWFLWGTLWQFFLDFCVPLEVCFNWQDSHLSFRAGQSLFFKRWAILWGWAILTLGAILQVGLGLQSFLDDKASSTQSFDYDDTKASNLRKVWINHPINCCSPPAEDRGWAINSAAFLSAHGRIISRSYRN